MRGTRLVTEKHRHLTPEGGDDTARDVQGCFLNIYKIRKIIFSFWNLTIRYRSFYKYILQYCSWARPIVYQVRDIWFLGYEKNNAYAAGENKINPYL